MIDTSLIYGKGGWLDWEPFWIGIGLDQDLYDDASRVVAREILLCFTGQSEAWGDYFCVTELKWALLDD